MGRLGEIRDACEMYGEFGRGLKAKGMEGNHTENHVGCASCQRPRHHWSSLGVRRLQGCRKGSRRCFLLDSGR